MRDRRTDWPARARRFAWHAGCAVLLAAAIWMALEYLAYLKPWREAQLRLMAAIALAAGGILQWYSGQWHSRHRLVWVLALTTAASFSGSALLIQYRHVAATNLPAVPPSVDPEATGKRGIWRYFQDKPVDDPGPPYRGSMNPDNANRLLAGRLALLGYPAVPLPADMRWTEDPYDDPSWNFQLHAMGYLNDLVALHTASGRIDYLQRGEDLVLDWIQDNSSYLFHPPSKFSWGDHATALRLHSWTVFWRSWSRSPLASPNELEVVLSSMIAHARRLADPGFYTEAHNHGIRQDLSLLYLAKELPELNEAGDWGRLARSRLGTQLRTTISGEGVHLEHSPAYHLNMLQSLQEIEALLRTEALASTAGTTGLSMRMAKFSAHLFQPDGMLVPFGDTTPKHVSGFLPVLSRYSDALPTLRYVLSGGSEGHRPAEASFYPESGYAFLRGYPRGTGYAKSIHLAFTAAAHGRTHKHADDLSFVLYGYGRQLLTDPGFYSYKRDAARRYIQSARAHNTVVVDGNSFSGTSTTLAGHVSMGSLSAVRGWHDNYPGLRHARTLLYVRPGLVFVVDEVLRRRQDGAPRLLAEQSFHLAPGLRVVVPEHRPGSAQVYEGASLVLSLLRLVPRNEAPAPIRNKAMVNEGYVSRSHGQLEPADVVGFARRGAEPLFVTALIMHDPSGHGTTYDPDAEVRDHELHLGWRESGRRVTAILSRHGALEIRLATGTPTVSRLQAARGAGFPVGVTIPGHKP